MVSAVDIGNMALTNIASRHTIESLTESTKEANLVNIWYDISRKATLEALDWGFARKRQALATHTEDPPSGEWQYRYQYPADCLKARRLENPVIVNQSIVRGVPLQLVEPDAIPFEIEMAGTSFQEKTILTDLAEATLVYTFDQDITDTFSSTFSRCLSFELSSRIAMALTGKLVIQEKMLEYWRLYLAIASQTDANEQVSRPPRDADHIRGRW